MSYSLRQGRGCYDRHTEEEFERVGVIEMRRGVVVPREPMHEAELDEVGGRTVIRWRGLPSERGTRVEGRLYLDSAGRPVLNRERISWLRRRQPRARYERRYRYPARLDLHRPPTPRCEKPPPAAPRHRGRWRAIPVEATPLRWFRRGAALRAWTAVRRPTQSPAVPAAA